MAHRINKSRPAHGRGIVAKPTVWNPVKAVRHRSACAVGNALITYLSDAQPVEVLDARTGKVEVYGSQKFKKVSVK
jgi:hypothetical protein